MHKTELKQAIERALQSDVDFPKTIGMLSIETANSVIIENMKRKDPEPLWLSLWYEGEVCCLFADSNVGKSIYAVQMANEIAKKETVLYFDFELSKVQFKKRYTDNGKRCVLSDKFFRLEFTPENLDNTDFDEALMRDIERAYLQSKAKVMIIDNLSFLCNESEKGEAAGTLMRNLTALKKKYDLSILVIAHTKKRLLSDPITQNDLNGSKRLFNFFDSVFAIGKSVKGENIRYVKQLKARNTEIEYGADNVIISKIVKTNCFLHFENIGYGKESEHLKGYSREDIIREAKDLKSQGKTQREIADIVGMSAGWVNKITKEHCSCSLFSREQSEQSEQREQNEQNEQSEQNKNVERYN